MRAREDGDGRVGTARGARAWCAPAFALIAALGGARARADDAADAFGKVDRGDVVQALSVLREPYRRAASDVWAARLYQDLRLEAGERDALVDETKAGWPEPRGPVGQYLVARLADRKDVDTLLQRVTPLLPDPLPSLYDQAWIAIATDHLPHAAGLLPRFKKAAPAREETALIEGRLLEAQGDRSAAERALAAFAAAHPEASEVRALWASMLIALRRHADAVAIADEALARARTPSALVARASIAVSMHEFDRAVKLLDEAGDRGRPALRAEAHALRAAMRLCAREYDAADAEAEAALKASPSSPEALRTKARGLELTGHAAEALQRLDAALALRPTWGRLYLEKAMVLKGMSDPKASRRALAEAKKRDPDLLEAVLQLGVLEEESGDWVAAEKAYRGVLKIDADHREAHRMLAGVYLSTGKLDAADEQAKWIQARFPTDPEAWTTSGRVAWKQDRFDDALAAFAKALEADPKYALAHLGRGWVLEDQDKRDEALKAYEQATAADPKLPLPHRYWAELLETGEDKKNALVHYKAYLDLGGEDPDEDVKHAVERLSK